MKARIKGTNEIVECLGIDMICDTIKGIECVHSNGGGEIIPGDCLIELENDFDWQSFRAEAAKDILCAMVPETHNIIGIGNVEYAIKIADELIKQLKEKEEK